MQNNMMEGKGSTTTKSNANFFKNLSFLKKRSFDVKFDLEGTGYSAVEKIGIGAYGVVCSALQSRTGDKVAIKKIPGVFDNKTVTKRTYREIKILKHFKHDNIISIREILKPREGPNDFRDVYVVLDLMESDLHQIIYSRQTLTEEHIRYFLYQILRGLKYIHSANVVHRDLKPNNILVRENCHLRIGDFGMARGILSSQCDTTDNFLTLYVATRWYRAPEIMFSLLEYSSAMDMWSVGCIFAEMLGRRHLFPGKDYIKQAQLIIEVLGSPSEKFLVACKSDLIKKFIKQLGHKKPIPWPTLYPKASRMAIDLLGKMVVLIPSGRVTVEQALRHPYFSIYHDPDDEPICVPAFNFDFEKRDMTIEQFRGAIYEEIIEYHTPENANLKSDPPVLRPAPKTSEPQQVLCQQSTMHSGFGSTLEATEQGVALQAFVKQLRERVKSTAVQDNTDKGYESHTTNQENQESVVPLHLLSDHSANSVSDSVDDLSTSGSVSCTQNLLVAPNASDDIEMLSAKSTDSKMDPASSELLAASAKAKQQESQPPTQEHQTISMDTKELIKAALRNANLKKRGESEVKDDGRPRPVTAAQRQREREDKRRKRKERALKRMKDKKGQEELLSAADKELLERWKNMQTPKTVSMADTDGGSPATPTLAVRCSEQETHSISLGTSQQQQLQGFPGHPRHSEQRHQPHPGSAIAPTVLNHYTLPHQIPQPSRHVETAVQQQQCAVSSTSAAGSQVENGHVSSNGIDLKQSNQDNGPEHQPRTVFSLLNPNQNEASLPGKVSQSGFSTLNVESLQLLGLLNLRNSRQLGNLGSLVPASYHQATHGVHPLLPAPSSSPPHLALTASTLHSKNGAVAVMADSPPSTLPQASHSQTAHDPAVTSTATPSSTPATTATTASVNTATTSSLSPNYFIQAGISLSDPTAAGGPGSFQAVVKWKDVTFERSSSNGNISVSHQSLFDMLEKKPSNLSCPLTSETSPPTSSSHSTATSATDNFDDISSNSNDMGFPNGHFNNQILSLPTIQVSCIGEDGTKPMLEGTSPNPMVSQEADVSSDLISALSKQLSKYQVEDSVPPSLALTPKGTGGGYGVGLNIDTLMAENLTDKTDSSSISPLSSSLLANWMDVTANMDIQTLEEELELSMQSPMALSYSDLRLCSS